MRGTQETYSPNGNISYAVLNEWLLWSSLQVPQAPAQRTVILLFFSPIY